MALADDFCLLTNKFHFSAGPEKFLSKRSYFTRIKNGAKDFDINKLSACFTI